MLKLNIYIRFVIIGVFLLLGIISAVWYGVLSSIPFFLGAVFFLAGYFLLGTISSTSEMIQNGEIDRAEVNLKLTKKPEWLLSSSRAYYHLLEGTIMAHRKDNKGTQVAFNKALKLGLPSGNEEAMIRLQLANIDASRNDWNAANKQITKIKSLSVSEPQLLEQVKMFEKAFKQRGQMKFQQQQQHQRGGGKRRR